MIFAVSVLISIASDVKNNSEIKRRILSQWGKEPEKKYSIV